MFSLPIYVGTGDKRKQITLIPVSTSSNRLGQEYKIINTLWLQD